MIRFRNFRYSYGPPAGPVLDLTDLSIEEGRFCVVTGPSGSGKSTLLRCLNGLVPHFHGGLVSGGVSVAGHDPVREGPRRMSRHVSFVPQDPERSFVLETVEDELVFSMENFGFPRDRMASAMDSVAGRLGIGSLLNRNVRTLSGGEKQLIAVAAAIVTKPAVLALDEPFSQLDAASCRRLLDAISCLRIDTGLTAIISSHRTDRLRDISDMTVDLGGEGPAYLQDNIEVTATPIPGEVRIEARGLGFAHQSRTLFENLDLSVRAGACLALTGPNGSGKTTLLRILAGFEAPATGEVIRSRDTAVGYVPQEPKALFFKDTLGEEIETSRALRSLQKDEGRVENILSDFSLSDFKDRNPFDLSTGEQQRAAVAAVLAGEPAVILLDEPTRGLDGRSQDILMLRLRRAMTAGLAVVLSTHDEAFARRLATETIPLGAIEREAAA